MMPKLTQPALQIGLSPAALEMAAFNWRGRLLRQERFALPGAPSGWRDVLAALQQQLQGGTWPGRVADVVLSSHFVRHCLLPDTAGIGGAAEQAGYVRHLFRGEYGAEVDNWRVAVDRTGAGARLACAIDAGLLELLAETGRAGGLRLRSLRPHLAAALNRVCRQVVQPKAWFVALEDGVCALALIESGRWRHVASARLGDMNGAALFKALRQQSALLAGAGEVRSVYLCGASVDLARTGGELGWQVQTLVPAAGRTHAGLLAH
jgi:hypothetical protein